MGLASEGGEWLKFVGQEGYQNEIRVKEKLRGQEVPNVNVGNGINLDSRVPTTSFPPILNDIRNKANGGSNSDAL